MAPSVLGCALGVAAALFLVGAAACSGQSGGPPSADAAAPPLSAADAQSGPDVPPRAGCRAPPTVNAAPRTIAHAVTLVNALPRPVTLACFLESLARPLRLAATSDIISLQPAVGARSPRIFLSYEGLVISVVPEGKGSTMAEFGEFVGADRTLKAEIAFPIDGPLDPAEPYRRIIDGAGTVCRGCHPMEVRADDVPFADAFVSGAIRPASRSLVELARLRHEHATCNGTAEPERCALFAALFEHGEVTAWEFPPTLRTIYD